MSSRSISLPPLPQPPPAARTPGATPAVSRAGAGANAGVVAGRTLPPLPRGGASDDLSPTQRRVMVGGIAAAHVFGLWALLQVPAVRDAVVQVAPMFVDIINPPAPPKPPEPTPPPPPRPVTKTPPPPLPVIAAAPSPAQPAFVVPTPPPEPAPPAPPVVMAPPAAPAPPAPPVTPAPPPAPKVIPASAVQFVVLPVYEYPRVSRQKNESGRVVVRFFLDEAGTAKQLQIDQSSGFVRLDDAALKGVAVARFKPYFENGKPMSGWVRLVVPFELEK